MPDLIPYTPPPVPAWLEGLLPDPGYQIKFLKADGSVHWASNPGPQTWALLSPYDETMIGGERGGSKSAGLIAWYAMGDASLPMNDPARLSFLNEPSFRGLMLRKEYQSMVEFVDEAMDFFRHFGCKPKDDPVIFEFKSGARIYTNHLGDKEAYEKYRGQGLTKIGIEELTQVPDERWYLKLLGSLRGKKQVRAGGRPPLRCQIMSTTNPDGPGASWVKKRFVKLYGEDGQLIPRNTPIEDQFSGLTRVFIPMSRRDNPYLRDNKQYEGMLLAQDEVTRRQWMEGDWDASGGQMFSSYRPNGPITAEERERYPWACHVPRQPVQLRPWWFRWGSLDIGYDHPAAAHKFCRNEQDKRIHVYDEFSARHMDSYELGVLLAKWWIPELEQLPDHQVTLYVSPDAFSKTDATKTRAEQLEAGMKEVLGPYGALLLRYNSSERSAMASNPAHASALFEQRRQQFAGKMGIALKAANDDRKNGCDYINQLLRFRPILTETQDELKARLTETFSRSGLEAYERELGKARHNDGPEILPRLQVWPACRELDRCLKEAVRGEAPKNEEYVKFNAVDGEGGDDALDGFRYGAMGFKEVQATIPKEYFVGERMANAQQQHVQDFGVELTDPTRLAMIAMRQSALYENAHGPTANTFSMPRASSSRHRAN